jgi:branched-chain amino acid transport system permease protein
MILLRKKIFWISLAIALSIILPLIIKTPYIHHILVLIGINVIVVLSLDMILGHAGLVSLGHAGFMGIGAYTCALLVMKYKFPFLLGLLGGMSTSSAFGLLIGYPSLRLKGHYFVIITFIIGIILTLFFTNLVSITNGPMGLPNIPSAKIKIGEILFINFDTKIKYYYLTLTFIFIIIYVKNRFYYSKMGRGLLAIREDEELGKSVGINTHLLKVIAFVISVAFTGMAGGLFAHYVRSIAPDSFTFIPSFYFFVMNLVGGSGTILGPIIGSSLLTVIDELSQLFFQPAWARVLFGVFLIVCIIYMPMGIMGLVKRLFLREKYE